MELIQFQSHMEEALVRAGRGSFEQLLEHPPSLLKDSSYLQPLSDPPAMRIEAREDLLQVIRTLLAESLCTTANRTLFLYGPPGTGKTLCVKHVLSELGAYLKKTKREVEIAYVNAGQTRNPYYTLLEIAQQIGVKTPSSGWQFTRLKQEFEKTKGASVIIAIDEADILLPKEREPLIYYLNRQPGIILILISNRHRDLDELPQRAKSTLQPFPINFQPYTTSQVQSILQARLQHALKPDSITPKPSNVQLRSLPTHKTYATASTSSSTQPSPPKHPDEAKSQPKT